MKVSPFAFFQFIIKTRQSKTHRRFALTQNEQLFNFLLFWASRDQHLFQQWEVSGCAVSLSFSAQSLFEAAAPLREYLIFLFFLFSSAISDCSSSSKAHLCSISSFLRNSYFLCRRTRRSDKRQNDRRNCNSRSCPGFDDETWTRNNQRFCRGGVQPLSLLPGDIGQIAKNSFDVGIPVIGQNKQP